MVEPQPSKLVVRVRSPSPALLHRRFQFLNRSLVRIYAMYARDDVEGRQSLTDPHEVDHPSDIILDTVKNDAAFGQGPHRLRDRTDAG